MRKRTVVSVVVAAVAVGFACIAAVFVASPEDVPVPLPLAARALNALGVVLDSVGIDLAPITHQSLFDEAVLATGGLTEMDAHGVTLDMDDHARESLRVLVDELAERQRDGQLTLLGRFLMRDLIVRGLVNRMQAIALMRQHGEAIFSQAIRDPVVVVGLPRSGTSAMVNLLAQHSKLGPLPMFQAFHPAGVPGELLPQAALANASHDPRIAIVDGVLSSAKYFMPPTMMGVHTIGTHHAEECVMLLMNSFARSLYSSMANLTKFEAYLWNLDHAPAFQFYKRQLQLLQWQRQQPPSVHWLLKTPNHLASLPELMQTLEGARVVWVHRDPVKAMASMCSMSAHLRSMSERRVDPRRVGEAVIRRYSRFANASVAARRDAELAAADLGVDLPTGMFVDVAFTDVVQQPVETACAVVEQLGLGLECDDGDRRRMQELMDTKYRRHKHGKHVYALGDFGLTEDGVRAEFASYVELVGEKGVRL